MRCQLGHPLLGNSMEREINDDELYVPDGYIQCYCCGEVAPHYIKDKEICQGCYTADIDRWSDERSGK